MSAILETPAVAPPSPLASFWRSFRANRGALAGLVVFALVVAGALLAGVLAPHDPIEQFRDALLTPPAWNEGGSPRFPLGTDEVGRDVLSRLLYGARLSLFIGGASVVMAMVPGIALGLVAAFYPRGTGTFILRLMDVMLALPSLLLAIAVVAVLGPGLVNTLFAIAIVAVWAFNRFIGPRVGVSA